MTHYAPATATVADEPYDCTADIEVEPATATAHTFAGSVEGPVTPSAAGTITFDSEDDAATVFDALMQGSKQGKLDTGDGVWTFHVLPGVSEPDGPRIEVRITQSKSPV
ncbi:hypothetical protein ABZ891_22865 [Streptomyces sp. NPDC047023]|uniref:hypothetical protein n=1 Tax=Streptomyces sp. NPDC047023 TaxID=3155139 RepID=UPI0033E07856